MPDIDRTADIKVTAAQGTVTAEIPLAGHASEHWLALFRKLASEHFSGTAPSADAAEREGRTWVIVRLLADYPARGYGVDAGYGKCPNRRGQWHGAVG
jgi:hypothetical protein